MAMFVAAYILYFSVRTVEIHNGLGTSAYDFGLYDQGVWLLSRFKAPFVTLMGRSLFGDHTSLILLFVAPFYWISASTSFLLVLQSVVIGLAAVPVYLYARRRLESGLLAVLFGVIFLLHPAVANTNLENYHPDSFLALFVGMGIYAALTERWRLYAVAVVLALLVKEDVALVMIPLGIWVMVRRDRRVGEATIAGSLMYMGLALFVIMRSLIGVPTLNLWRIPFGGPAGFISEGITRPGNVVDHLLSDGRPFYLWQMLVPAIFVIWRRPGVALISGLVLITNVISTFSPQYEIQFHYSLVAVPAIVFGAIWAVEAFMRHQALIVTGLLVVTVWTSFLWGPMPWSRTVYASWPPSHPVAVAGADIIRDVPEDAIVSAHYSLTAHLARREQIYMYPNPFKVSLYGTDISQEGSRLPAAEDVEYVVLPTDISTLNEHAHVWEEEKHAFKLVRSNAEWSLYVRR